MPTMIEPNVLYALEDLRKMLHGVVELKTFMERLGLKEHRVFRDAVWGWEILAAAQKAPAFSEVGRVDEPMIRGFMASGPCARGGKRANNGPVRRLTAEDVLSSN